MQLIPKVAYTPWALRMRGHENEYTLRDMLLAVSTRVNSVGERVEVRFRKVLAHDSAGVGGNDRADSVAKLACTWHDVIEVEEGSSGRGTRVW